MSRVRLKSSWSASTRSSRICSPLAILRCSLSVEPGACAEVDGIPPRPAVASGDCGLTPRAGQDGAAQSLLAVCRDPRRRQPQACHRGRIQRQTRQRSQAPPWSACPLLRPNVPSLGAVLMHEGSRWCHCLLLARSIRRGIARGRDRVRRVSAKDSRRAKADKIKERKGKGHEDIVCSSFQRSHGGFSGSWCELGGGHSGAAREPGCAGAPREPERPVAAVVGCFSWPGRCPRSGRAAITDPPPAADSGSPRRISGNSA